jgi:hypothetical protein
MNSHRSNDDHRRTTIDKDDLLEVAAEYLNHPEIRTDKFDRILLDAVAFDELSAMETDMRKFLIFATINSGIKFLTVYVALPALAYFLFMKEHGTLPTTAVVGWLIVASLHLLGAPFRWHDLARARAILRQLQDLRAALGDRSVSPKKFSASLASASGAGVVLDVSAIAIVNRMTAGDVSVVVPAQLGAVSPVS